MRQTERVMIGFYVEPEVRERVAGLARAARLSRSELLRRSIDLAARHLEEVAVPVPEDLRKRWTK